MKTYLVSFTLTLLIVLMAALLWRLAFERPARPEPVPGAEDWFHTKTRATGHSASPRASSGIHLQWVGETRAGEPIREDAQERPVFVF